jgi:hypothetical protein
MRTFKLIFACLSALILSSVLLSAPAGVSFEKGDGRIDVLIDGKPFTAYYFSPDLPRPYFHPLRSADGRIITRGFPMIQDASGEEKDRDHPHHRSCWFTHGDVNGVDYWSSESAKIPGRIVNRAITTVKGGAKEGTLGMEMDWIDNTGRKVLSQKEEVTFRGEGDNRYMDFDIRLTATDQDVKFGDTKEGSFAVRLATPLKERSGAVIVNSKGSVGMKNCWGKKAEWVDYSGDLGGSKVGLAMMDHPGNLRYPTTWHVRDYGLFAANPFGLHDFTGDKTVDGSYLLQAGKTLRFRYRILIHPGDAAQAKIADEYQKYLGDTK